MPRIDQNCTEKISPSLASLVVKVDSLVLDPDNARLHPERSISAIKESLTKFGQVKPVVVNRNGMIVIAGNGTVQAARELGWKNIAANVVDMSEIEATGYGLADNRVAELSEWNPEVVARLGQFLADASESAVGFTSEELREMRAQGQVTHANPDAVPEAPVTAVTRLGDLWLLDGHRLLCGDATNAGAVANLLGSETPFICVTDPPYGVNYDPSWRNVEAAKGNLAYAARRVGKVYNDDRADWSDAWRLFPGDVLYSWHPAGVDSLVHAAAIQKSGFVIRMQMVWAKSNFPIGRGDYHVRHEPCWYAVRNGRPSRRTDDRTQTTLWSINLDKNIEGGHSTQKPVECMARPIRNHGGLDDAVYDPFVGSGTTIIAAQQLGRRCFAIEINPTYCDVTLQRWANFTGQDPIREDGVRWSSLVDHSRSELVAGTNGQQKKPHPVPRRG